MSDQKPPEAILKALGEPFPRQAIKSRQGGGGKSFSYIETHAVIHRLNSATNGCWDFRVVNVEWRADLLIVQGELTIPGLGTRAGFGVQKVAPNAGEDLVKGGASDSLKKCATLFGVALDLYGVDYEAEPVPASQSPQGARTAPQDAPEPMRPPAGGMSGFEATDRQRELIQALARELKMPGPAINELSVEVTGSPTVGITRQNASKLIDVLQERRQKAREGMPS